MSYILVAALAFYAGMTLMAIFATARDSDSAERMR